MGRSSRRDFLKFLGSTAAFATVSRDRRIFAAESSAFEILVVGDSLVWGQGLEETEKFYRHTKLWIRDEVFSGTRAVKLNVKAHSGATIKLSEKERKALRRAGRDSAEPYHPEINVSFPTIEKQLELARDDYRDPRQVGLILLSGGLPEVGVGEILNLFKDERSLRAAIKIHCHDHMSELLDQAADSYPEALIAVIGYYPIITGHTPVKRIVNDILEVYNWPGWTKPLLNNSLNRILWRRYRRKMIARSNLWYDGSTTELRRAVERLNAKQGAERAVFVPTNFGRENGYGARNTYLWKVAEKGRAADRKREEREAECRPTLDSLREDTDLKYRSRVCELASIGHPNPAGSKVIAASIRETLQALLDAKVSNL